MGLSRDEFAEELGYVGTERNNGHRLGEYERGKKPIPQYIARLAFMIHEHWEAEEHHLPDWPDWPAYRNAKPVETEPKLHVKHIRQGSRYANPQGNRRHGKVVSV